LIDYGFNISNPKYDLGVGLFTAGVIIGSVFGFIVLMGVVSEAFGWVDGAGCGSFVFAVILFCIICIPLLAIGAQDQSS